MIVNEGGCCAFMLITQYKLRAVFEGASFGVLRNELADEFVRKACQCMSLSKLHDSNHFERPLTLTFHLELTSSLRFSRHPLLYIHLI